ncbi:MAG TPA: hypothetical protein VH186_25075 [Chloroflexia bacterium]|nr:hypothetical protein [Chloroflexia bacterium]
MSKEIVISPDSNPKSPKYFVWKMDENEAEEIKLAIGEKEDEFPLLSTLSDYHEDFLCEGPRLMALCQETIDLQISLEEKHRETRTLVKLLTMVGGLAVLSHDQHMGVYAYGD